MKNTEVIAIGMYFVLCFLVIGDMIVNTSISIAIAALTIAMVCSVVTTTITLRIAKKGSDEYDNS